MWIWSWEPTENRLGHLKNEAGPFCVALWEFLSFSIAVMTIRSPEYWMSIGIRNEVVARLALQSFLSHTFFSALLTRYDGDWQKSWLEGRRPCISCKQKYDIFYQNTKLFSIALLLSSLLFPLVFWLPFEITVSNANRRNLYYHKSEGDSAYLAKTRHKKE